MAEKTDLDKLRILLPHWIEHNHAHAHEFADWAEKARAMDNVDVAADIERAAKLVHDANDVLSTALEKLGGALETDAAHEYHHA